MKTLGIFCAVILGAIALAPLDLTARSYEFCITGDEGLCRGEGIDLDLDNGSIIFKHGEHDGTVEITKDFALIVNGDELRLHRDQQLLVRD